MKTRNSLFNFSKASKIKKNATAPLDWLPHYSDILRTSPRGAMLKKRLAALTRKAERLGVLPLVVDVIQIERGQKAGAWVADERGRLWVFLEQ